MTLHLSDINLYTIGNTIQIVGIVWQGEGKTFLTSVPERTPDISSLQLMPLTLSEWVKLLRQSDIQETEIFAQDPSGITKIILRKSQRTIDTHMQWAVFKKFNYSCVYCDKDTVPLTVDHIITWETGGATIFENLVSCCKNCNKLRGRADYEEWINSEDYKKVSKNLSEERKRENSERIKILPYLKTFNVKNIRSR